MKIKELKQELKNYHTKRTALKQDFAEKKSTYAITYGNGEKYKEVMARTREKYDSDMQKLNADLKEQIDLATQEAESRMAEYITRPVPDDLLSTIAAIKESKTNLTEAEAAVYLTKYKDNYTAKKAIANVLYANGSMEKTTALLNSYDRAKESMQVGKNLLGAFLNNPDSYQYNLLLAENGNPLDDIDENIESFLGE